MDHAIDDLEVGDDTTEGVEHGVKDQRLKRSLGISLWMRNALNHGIQNILNTLTRFA